MVDKLQKFVDMARSPEEKSEDMPMTMDQPDYPYGLCISFSQDELDKLDLEDDCEVGDMLHLFCIAKVSSVSKREINGEPNCRIEMQITHVACHSEDNENEDAEQEMRPRRNLYK